MSREPRDIQKQAEERERMLNPHWAEEQRAAATEAVARLRGRGITVDDTEPLVELGDLLLAVERFEEAVQMHGGDLMVDDLNSSEPDDPRFVVPRREDEEDLRAYAERIDRHTAALWEDMPGVE